jgi:branched-chain amino acid aminotransferase
MNNQRTAFFNGEFMAEQHVCLHVSDLSIQRGYGVFDFFRVVNNVPVFMNEHIERFFKSAEALGLEVGVKKERIKSIIHELIERNNSGLSGIKLTLTGGYSPGGYEVILPNFFITQHPLQPRPETRGFKVVLYEHIREQPEIKNINYLTGLMLQKKLAADDVLYHRNGEISEFPRSTFFIVTKDNEVVTPGKNVLQGITRKKILELSNGVERTVTIDDIKNAKEAFITSTTKQVLPIIQVDDIIIGDGKPGEITKQLDAQLQELISSISKSSLSAMT